MLYIRCLCLLCSVMQAYHNEVHTFALQHISISEYLEADAKHLMIYSCIDWLFILVTNINKLSVFTPIDLNFNGIFGICMPLLLTKTWRFHIIRNLVHWINIYTRMWFSKVPERVLARKTVLDSWYDNGVIKFMIIILANGPFTNVFRIDAHMVTVATYLCRSQSNSHSPPLPQQIVSINHQLIIESSCSV